MSIMPVQTESTEGTQTLLDLAKAVGAKRIIPIHSDAPERLGDLIPGATPVDDGEWLNI